MQGSEPVYSKETFNSPVGGFIGGVASYGANQEDIN